MIYKRDVFVVCRIRDDVAEYFSHLYWTQDVRFAKAFDKPVELSDEQRKTMAVIPYTMELNIENVCLVAQDNPRLKECLRHGSTVG